MDTHILENLFDELFPITRSISGNGLRKSLSIIGNLIPLNILEYQSGTECFDWTVPDEWNINEAHIKRTNGEKVVDFKDNNLHIMGYSIPFEDRISASELKKHLNYIEDKPDAIPFVTSYYERRWGFSLQYSKFLELKDTYYDVLIDSTIEPGSVSVGDCLIPGISQKEILLFSHIGHPSMANDQLSGPLTLVAVTDWLLENKNTLKYSYRIIFAPETIGAIAYIHSNLNYLKKNCIGGYTVVCTGDSHPFTYRMSKKQNSVSDYAMENALIHSGSGYKITNFSPLGCDERHFNSHGIGIPIGSIMRLAPGYYPEYHTSHDNKSFISFENINHTADLVINAIKNMECDARITAIHKNCEPKLDKYGLYPTLSNKNSNTKAAQNLISLWAYADGSTLSEIAKIMDIPVCETRELADKLAEHNIIRIEAL
ncbi:MAG: DUF4910 domain-containing protein [Clostridiales bacterium]|nr:DUF4910 domain-containing protein [Clostridiales bacterium]